MNQRYVLTAGPCSGKTTTLRELSARGYNTIPESARRVIEARKSEGMVPDVIQSHESFSTWVEESDRELEQHTYEGPTFLDRSLADCIAYQEFYGEIVDNRLIAECRDRYDGVFLLDQLDFESDYARMEDEKEAFDLHNKIADTYRKLGYDPIRVPVKPVPERCDFIEFHLCCSL